MTRDHGEHFSHAITAEDRPALEHLLVSVLPPGIIGLESQPWINHYGQVGFVLEADGDAGEIGVGAQRDLLNRQAPSLRELDQPGVPRLRVLRGAAGLLYGFACWLFFQGAPSFCSCIYYSL
jgi:hypothetical protein